MTWAGWIVLAYFAVSAWGACGLFLFHSGAQATKGRAFASSGAALVVMWLLPALMLAALLYPNAKRK